MTAASSPLPDPLAADPPAFRPTARERWADGAVHAAGLAFGVGAVVTLAVTALSRGGGAVLASLLVYGAGLLGMLGCSAAYNMIGGRRRGAPSWTGLLRRLDHAAIFSMIAGTYTPFMLLAVGGARGLGLLVLVWAVAVAGMALKLLAPGRIERVSVALYLVLGWAGLAVIDRLLGAMSPGPLILLGAGGVLYCVGVVFYRWERLPYQTAIWHLFVLAAAVCHFAAILVVAEA